MKEELKHTIAFRARAIGLLRGVSYVLLAYFSVLMFMIVFKYWPISTQNNFLSIKQTEVKTIPNYLTLFYIHVFSAGLAIPAGFTQFSSFLLTKYRKLHRVMGYIYVLSILFLAAPSGLFIGLFANGGIVAKTSFVTLAVLWFYFTYRGFSTAKKHQFDIHRDFMIRSYALTISALTLRMWKVVIVWLWHPAPMDTYVVISLLGWIPNSLLAEFIISKKRKPLTNV